ncbi:MAG TPA: lytic transglycosylase domain-containing protein [Candidatus Limnocylindria bacterium]
MPSPRPAAGRRRGAYVLLVGITLAGTIALSAFALGRVDLAMIGGRIPPVAHDAYVAAARTSGSITDACDVGWVTLAGIGQVESRHGRIDASHSIAADGTVSPPIRGRALDGTRGTQTIPDTDGGQLDGDETWDRAMGPLQFIPTTWSELGRDGNGDGVADPDNLYDAALTAAAHLCLREPGDYEVRDQLRRALIAYNADGEYADEVLEWMDRYASRPLDEVLEEIGS